MKNKISLIAFWGIVFNLSLATAQERNTFDYIYDGGHLVLDIFNSVKKGKADDTKKERQQQKTKGNRKEASADADDTPKTSSFCFENKSEMLVYIELKRKTSNGSYSSTVYELTIPPGETECSLGLHSGIYHYKIQDKAVADKPKTIKEGDVLIDEKEEIVKEIK